MLIVMKTDATQEEIDAAVSHVERIGLRAHLLPGGARTVIATSGDREKMDPEPASALPGVQRVIRVTEPYKLSSREFQPTDSVIEVGGVKIGAGQELAVIAGPCAIETPEQALEIAEAVKDSGANLMRGGIYKPRTSPFSFQGMHEAGLEVLDRVRSKVGLGVVTEAVDEASLELIEQHADMIQIGARNMQNFALLRRAAKSKLPVLLKRGMGAKLEEWLTAADYVLAGGNPNVVLCERGIRTFATHCRNTLDLSVVPAVKELSHLPVIVDPSHGTGRREYVPAMALAAVASGADGIMVEVHNNPARALSDGVQSMFMGQFRELMEQVRAVAQAVRRGVGEPNRAPV